jgi:hypothetical protein
MSEVVPQPTSIRHGAIALVIAIAVSALTVWFQDDAKNATEKMSLGPWIAFCFLNSVFALFLFFSFRGRNWARWVVLLWCSAGWFALIWSFFYEPYQPPIAMVFAVLASLIEVWGCWQLFAPSSSSWFHRARGA